MRSFPIADCGTASIIPDSLYPRKSLNHLNNSGNFLQATKAYQHTKKQMDSQTASAQAIIWKLRRLSATLALVRAVFAREDLHFNLPEANYVSQLFLNFRSESQQTRCSFARKWHKVFWWGASQTYPKNGCTSCTNSVLDITSWLNRTKQRKKLSYTSGFRNAFRTLEKGHNEMSKGNNKRQAKNVSLFFTSEAQITLSKKAYSFKVPYFPASLKVTSFSVELLSFCKMDKFSWCIFYQRSHNHKSTNAEKIEHSNRKR